MSFSIKNPRPALSNFSPPELKLLSNNGIRRMEIVDGCPNDCIGCGMDAPPYEPRKSMSPESLAGLTEGIKGHRQNGIELLYRKPFARRKPELLTIGRRSDSLHYHARDIDGNEWTLYDVLAHLSRELGVRISTTITTWMPGDNFRSRAMREIVKCMTTDPAFNVGLIYSFKLLARRALRDYDLFLENLVRKIVSMSALGVEQAYGDVSPRVLSWKRKLGDSDKPINLMLSSQEGLSFYDWLTQKHVEEFIAQSRQVGMMAGNLKVLAGLPPEKTNIMVNYVESPEKMAPEFSRYRSLVSEEMIMRVREHCLAKSGLTKEMFEWESQPFQGVSPRSLADLGIGALGLIARMADQSNVSHALTGIFSPYAGFRTLVESDGRMGFWSGDPKYFAAVHVTPELIELGIKKHESKRGMPKDWREWAARYASMSGMSVFGG